MLRIVALVLSAAGLLDALYFTLAFYGRVRGSRWIPEVLCAREDSICVTVVRTPDARVLGPPNSLLGVFYYLAMAVWAVRAPWKAWRWYPAGRSFFITFDFRMIMLTLSLITLCMAVYLIYALRRRLGVNCYLCYAAHAINAALFWVLLASKS